MKKSTFLLAAAMFCGTLSTFAQNDIKVTLATDLTTFDPTFKFNDDYKYYAIYLDGETQAKISEDRFVYIGADDNNGRHLDVWQDTGTFEEPGSINSFGVPGAYMSFKVGSAGWSGGGYRVDAEHPIDLSGITDEYTLHMAVMATKDDVVDFKFSDGRDETVADIVLGDGPYEDAAAVANFDRDGEWYNVDIPMSYLSDNFGLSYKHANKFGDNKYILTFLAGGNAGFTINWDAIFFYGPKNSTGIKNIEAEKNFNSPVSIYTTNGKLVTMQYAKANKGVYIVKQDGKTKKVAL